MKNQLRLIFIVILIIFGNLSIMLCNSNQVKIIYKFIGIIDSCLTPELKECIINEGLLERGYGNCNNLSWTQIRVNDICFSRLDSIIETDSNCIEYFGELLISTQRYVSYVGEIRTIIENIYHKNLNRIEYDFDQEIDSLRRLKKFVDAQREMWLTADTINGNYIPKDIEEAIREINRILDSASIAEIKNYRNEEVAVGMEHFGLGYIIRNMWKLGGSRFLHDTGLEEADYISGLVTTAYYRHLNNKPINLDELIEEYKKQEEKYHLQNE
jgi:hypothetical protein